MAIGLRPLQRADLPLLGRWLAAPHVARWWREDAAPAAVEARYGPALDGVDRTELLLVLDDGGPVGFAQGYRLDDDPGWARSLAPAGVTAASAGIDYLLGSPDVIGRGLGPELIARLVEGIWVRHPDLTAVVASVDPANRRSWRALEKCGFVRVWEGEIESDDPSDEGPSASTSAPGTWARAPAPDPDRKAQ